MPPVVGDNAMESRFEIREDGRLAGILTYARAATRISFTHLEILPEFERRGLAGALTRAALDEARTQRLSVLPYCPFVRHWILQHPEYQDLVPGPRRDRFGLGGTAPSDDPPCARGQLTANRGV